MRCSRSSDAILGRFYSHHKSDRGLRSWVKQKHSSASVEKDKMVVVVLVVYVGNEFGRKLHFPFQVAHKSLIAHRHLHPFPKS